MLFAVCAAYDTQPLRNHYKSCQTAAEEQASVKIRVSNVKKNLTLQSRQIATSNINVNTRAEDFDMH
ncbi:unnamed protein product [Echinostoma caproni]|uniref:Secreted protein n=1 Tax=Echinostoma caproni TaxID=27848 RepID=A0A183AAB6_9TREM|nr:unnamed protein product [Echinostoma caproni]